MTPLTPARQTTLDSHVEVRPAATTWRYRDYWGTQVTAFDLHDAAQQLEVTATSLVETSAAPARVPPPLGWDDAARPRRAPTRTPSCSRRRR